MIDKEVIKMAMAGKYTEFSSSIRSEIASKTAAHPIASNHIENQERIKEMKNLFKEINSL